MQSRARVTIGEAPFGLTMSDDSISGFFFRRSMRKNPGRPIGLVPLILLFSLLFPMAVETDPEANPSSSVLKSHKIKVTAYTNVPESTDSTPNETASLLRIRPKHYMKVIALSRDLAKNYKFGDKFELWINGKPHLVEYQDVMAQRHINRIDFLLPSVKKCQIFGEKDGILIPLAKGEKKTNHRPG